MKKFIACFLVVGALFTNVAMAQDNKQVVTKQGNNHERPSVERRAEMISENMKGVLALNHEQFEKVKAVNLEHEREMEKLRKNGKIRDKYDSMIQKRDNDIKLILDDVQKVNFENRFGHARAQSANSKQ
jgi:hypothetical protein